MTKTERYVHTASFTYLCFIHQPFCPSDDDVFLTQAHLISTSATCSSYDLLSGLPNLPEPPKHSSYPMYKPLPLLLISWWGKYFYYFNCWPWRLTWVLADLQLDHKQSLLKSLKVIALSLLGSWGLHQFLKGSQGQHILPIWETWLNSDNSTQNEDPSKGSEHFAIGCARIPLCSSSYRQAMLLLHRK